MNEYSLHPYELPINMYRPMKFKYWYNFVGMLDSLGGSFVYDRVLAPYSAIMTIHGSSIRFKTEADAVFFLLRFS